MTDNTFTQLPTRCLFEYCPIQESSIFRQQRCPSGQRTKRGWDKDTLLMPPKTIRGKKILQNLLMFVVKASLYLFFSSAWSVDLPAQEKTLHCVVDLTPRWFDGVQDLTEGCNISFNNKSYEICLAISTEKDGIENDQIARNGEDLEMLMQKNLCMMVNRHICPLQCISLGMGLDKLGLLLGSSLPWTSSA
ncbi:hypothetical protein CEXT_234311 [Caerostris extrusa]|uniref:Uncharacterized protein n=1 Tax=Caerostris extrusa TaxID=172846 RepID=A0AAV4QUT3_CAEEX|nr:hypothetical protein CEXT_234311 [Caerostris extrusa]